MSDQPTVIDIVDDNSDDEVEMTEEEGKIEIENEKLKKWRIDQDQEIRNLKAQINALNKGLKMWNSSTNILDEILEVGKEARDNTWIGFDKGNMFKEKQDTKFVSEGWHHQSRTIGTTTGHRWRRSKVWYCHYYYMDQEEANINHARCSG
ncbi:hypothetical protein LIER_29344 [Lithospermum erythrorhizon]|uniref:Uncharacterized protein n=1 Tax=Lithospermum erythrorhizon TaxID=34254 RepID=A0AAV3RJB0_LITER